jgi:Asp-tRNA(Asn)/Glu-tRNA(Gln) amidotransferase A subunit family amidase
VELNELTLVEALGAIYRRDCSAVDVARACLARIAEREAVVGAWQCLLADEQLLVDAAETAETNPLRGLLCGVKDTIDTGDMPTELGSELYRGRRPAVDADAVAAIRRSGGVVAGKTVTTEFAYFAPGKTVNPRDPERSPGGSSSGSAAAVADCMVPLALGSQTAGSVTRPASYCGCVGYVASHGSLPLAGVRQLSPSLDSLGIFARSVADVEVARAVLSGRRVTLAALGTPLTHMPCLAVTDGTAIGEVDPEMVGAVERLVRTLEAAGVIVEPFAGESLLAELTSVHELIMAFEAARALAAEAEHGDRLSPQLRDLISAGRDTDEAEYREALAFVARAGRELHAAFGRVDAIIAPAAPGVAPRGAGTGSPHLSRPWQALQLPTIALPAARSKEGLPLGVQLVGARDRDDRLLGLARWIEEQIPAPSGTGALA